MEKAIANDHMRQNMLCAYLKLGVVGQDAKLSRLRHSATMVTVPSNSFTELMKCKIYPDKP